MWVGYHRDSIDSQWIWADGGQTKNITLEWSGLTESLNKTGYDCAVILTEQIIEGNNMIQPEICNSSLPYICEIEPYSLLGLSH